MEQIQLKSNEQIIWKRVEKKNLLPLTHLKSFLMPIFILVGIIIALIIVFSHPSVFIVVFLLLFAVFFYLMGIYKLIYDQKVRMGFPPSKDELKHYTEYTIITNQRFLQKDFYHYEVDVPARWRKSHSTYNQFNRNYYPSALMKKEKDLLMLDLTKMKVIVDNRAMNEIYFLEKYVITHEEYIINYSENIFWPKDPYLEFANIIFQEKSERERVRQILKETFNLTLVFENDSGRIYMRGEKK